MASNELMVALCKITQWVCFSSFPSFIQESPVGRIFRDSQWRVGYFFRDFKWPTLGNCHIHIYTRTTWDGLFSFSILEQTWSWKEALESSTWSKTLSNQIEKQELVKRDSVATTQQLMKGLVPRTQGRVWSSFHCASFYKTPSSFSPLLKVEKGEFSLGWRVPSEKTVGLPHLVLGRLEVGARTEVKTSPQTV